MLRLVEEAHLKEKAQFLRNGAAAAAAAAAASGGGAWRGFSHDADARL